MYVRVLHGFMLRDRVYRVGVHKMTPTLRACLDALVLKKWIVVIRDTTDPVPQLTTPEDGQALTSR